MKYEELKKRMKKQHYEIVGEHSAVQVCRWTKKSLKDEGVCYKEKFYGIKSHLCCQMTPWLGCQNRCLHCWRPIEFNFEFEGNIDSPKEIVDACIKKHKELLIGFKGRKQINMKLFEEAMNPNQFAISLSGEPTMYSKLPELIEEIHSRNMRTFIVSNGTQPKMIEKLLKNLV